MGICGSKVSQEKKVSQKNGDSDGAEAPSIVLTTATPSGSSSSINGTARKKGRNINKETLPSVPRDPSVENMVKVQPARVSATELPKEYKPDRKDCAFSNLVSQEAVKLPRSLPPDVAFEIEDCKESQLFVGTVVSQVMIDFCENCFIYVAPASGSVFIRDCTDCTIIVAAHQIRFKNCKRLKVLLYSTTQPVIESSTDIHIGCFQYTYTELESQFRKAGLPVLQNEWSDIYDFTPSHDSSNPHWRLLTTKEAMEITIRFPSSTSFEITKSEQTRPPKECRAKELKLFGDLTVPITESKSKLKSLMIDIESGSLSLTEDYRLFVTGDPEKETLEILRKFPVFIDILGSKMIKFKDAASREPFTKSHIPAEIYDRSQILYCVILKFTLPDSTLVPFPSHGGSSSTNNSETNQDILDQRHDQGSEKVHSLPKGNRSVASPSFRDRHMETSVFTNNHEAVANHSGTSLSLKNNKGSDTWSQKSSKSIRSVRSVLYSATPFNAKKQSRSIDMTQEEIAALVEAQKAMIAHIPAYSHLSYLSSSASDGKDDLLALSSILLS